MRRTAVMLAALALVAGACCVLLPTVQVVRETDGWKESAFDLTQIGIALEGWHETFGSLPPPTARDRQGRPTYSWRVSVLPMLELGELYKEFRQDEPWDSLHNAPLGWKVPRRYDRQKRLPDPASKGSTRFQLVTGPGTAFERDGLTWGDFPDGRANTLLAVEAGDPVPWTKPGDYAYDPAGPLPPLGTGSKRYTRFGGRVVRSEPGFVGLFADGRARFVPFAAGEAAIRAAMTRAGGEREQLPE